MTTTTRTQYKQAEIESEAGIYAEGTRYSGVDLVQAWSTDRKEGERLQEFFERFLLENCIETQAESFLVSRTTPYDINEVIDALNNLDLSVNQDWDNESTTWMFADGSKVRVCGMYLEAIDTDE